MWVVQIIVLVLLVLNLLATIAVLSGFWDMYKRIRHIETNTSQVKGQEVSKYLQDIGSGKVKIDE